MEPLFVDPLRPFVDTSALVATEQLFPNVESLRKTYLPNSLLPMDLGGVQVLQRNDPILRYLAPVNTEATYRMMRRTETVIQTSIHALNSSLLGFGYGVTIARHRRSSAGAVLLREMVEQALRQVVGLRTAIQEASYAIWEGWRPVQLWWKPDGFRYKGKAYWSIDRIFVHEQDRFWFTPDRLLVWRANVDSPELLQPDGPDSLGWTSITCGATVSPYGEAKLQGLYLIWRLKQFCLEKFGRGMANAISGIPVFQEGPTGGFMPKVGGESVGQSMQAVLGQVNEAMRLLEERGFLLLRSGFEMKQLVNTSYSNGYVGALAYLDHSLQLAIEQQHLTSSVGSSGSRAAADVQERTKMDQVRWVAGELQPLMQSIVCRIVETNVPDPDPEDIPEFRFRVTGLVNMDAVKAFCALGGRVNAADVADDQGIPMAAPEDPDEEVLRQLPTPSPFGGGAPAAPSAGGADGGGPRPDGGDGQEQPPADGGPGTRDRNVTRDPQNAGKPGNAPNVQR